MNFFFENWSIYKVLNFQRMELVPDFSLIQIVRLNELTCKWSSILIVWSASSEMINVVPLLPAVYATNFNAYYSKETHVGISGLMMRRSMFLSLSLFQSLP